MLYYIEKGKGPTVVFLHGFLENSEMWNLFADKLSENYRVLCIDLPGHGQSAEITNEVNRMEDIAEKVNEVLEHLGIEKITMIGHSMGGYVSLAFMDLYRNKIEGLGLFYSTTLADDDVKKEQRLKAAEVAAKNPKEFFRVSISNLFAQKNLKYLQPEIEQAISWANETSLLGISAALKGMRLRLDRTEMIRKEIENPVLIIAGEYDNVVKSSELEEKLKPLSHVSYYKLPTGHMGVLEAPKECLLIIENWLDIKVYKK